MRRPALAFTLLLLLTASAAALVGGASVQRDTGAGRHLVIVIGARKNFCTGTALTRDLVLTAGHCVAPPSTYYVVIGPPPALPLKSVAVHPRYSAKDYANGRVTADVALLKLEKPLPERVQPAALADSRPVAPGDRFVIAGMGVTAPGGEEGIAVPRAATLVATGRPGNLQIRLVDPVTRGERAGLGACIGDSGGPAFVESDGRLAVIGVVSWATGPNGSEGCGGMTGLTPLTLYRGWIEEQARKLGSPLAP